MHPVRDRVEYNGVLRRIAAFAPPPRPSTRVPLAEAPGRVASRAVPARFDTPAFARSALDGYALRAEDAARVPAGLRVAGSVRVGSRPRGRAVRPGEAFAIATGAPVPAAASAVVRVEETRREGDRVWVDTSPNPGDGIDPAGSDIRAGELLLRAGGTIGILRVAALAAQGIERVEVETPPLVSVQPTGSEIRPPGSRLAPGEVYDSNGPAVAAIARAAGARVRLRSPLPDDPRSIGRALASDRADVMAFVGGSSAGREDYLAQAVRDAGEVWVHGVALQPGRPTLLGALGPRAVVGLPGHPTSCLAATFLVLRPLLARFGSGITVPPSRQRPMAEDLELPRQLTYFRPVRDEAAGVRPLFTRASRISSFAFADGYLVERGPRRLRRGDPVTVFPV